MWEKIKNFFKWIADHTGISWVARKISSGWKWLFGGKANTTQQNASQQDGRSDNEKQEHAQANDQSKGHTTLKTLDDEVNPDQPVPPKQPVSSNKPNFVQQNTKPGNYLEFTDNKLLFITTNENYKFLEAKCKNEDQKGKVIPGEFRVFVEFINNENFCITGSYDSQQDVSGGKKSVSITSIRKQNPQSLVLSNPSEMMYQVGLDENRKLVEITRISRKPFKTATLEQPKPNTTTTQQTVNNDSNKEVAAEEQAPNLNKNVDSKGGLGSEVSDEDDIEQPKSLEVQEDEVVNDMQNQGQSQNSNGMAGPLAKPDQGSGDEPNQSSFDNESVKDDDKKADNPQPEISANGSAPTDSSSFDIVSSQETTPDELQEPDEDKELARQSEADQKAPANDDGPNSLVATPEVQTASNDKTK